jgi:hypothetical protein
LVDHKADISSPVLVAGNGHGRFLCPTAFSKLDPNVDRRARDVDP